jgi:hypothetical protein
MFDMSELYGYDHRRTLAAANNLAVSHRLTGNIAAAFRLDVDALNRLSAALGHEHPSTLLCPQCRP